MLPTISGEFRAVADPELRFAPSGTAVGTIRLVANSRKKTDAGEWVDDKVVWLRGVTFKQQAENLAESVSKGDLVLVTGKLQTEEWEKDGEKKQSYTILIDSIGPSLARNAARPMDTSRTAAAPAAAAPADDPWAVPAGGDEPPF